MIGVPMISPTAAIQTAHTAAASIQVTEPRTHRVGHHVNRVRLVLGTILVYRLRIVDIMASVSFVVTLRPSTTLLYLTLSDRTVHVLLFKVFHASRAT
jgi:Na+-translocating ferredoxin:NAD+ oxidoreductase RnfD subunit